MTGWDDARPVDAAAEAERAQHLREVVRTAVTETEKPLRRALVAILDEIKARAWLTDGRGSYAWNDDAYRREAGWAMDAVRAIAEKALALPAPKGDA